MNLNFTKKRKNRLHAVSAFYHFVYDRKEEDKSLISSTKINMKTQQFAKKFSLYCDHPVNNKLIMEEFTLKARMFYNLPFLIGLGGNDFSHKIHCNPYDNLSRRILKIFASSHGSILF